MLLTHFIVTQLNQIPLTAGRGGCIPVGTGELTPPVNHMHALLTATARLRANGLLQRCSCHVEHGCSAGA